MSNKIYVVKHCYGTDGGFGDYVGVSDVVFVTSDKKAAEDWIARWDKPFVYDEPYSSLDCYNFELEEFDILDSVDPSKQPSEFEGFYDPNFCNHTYSNYRNGMNDIYDDADNVIYEKLVELHEHDKERI